MSTHNLPLTRHAANECGGWVKIVKRFRLPHTMGVASFSKGDSIITVTFLYFCRFIQKTHASGFGNSLGNIISQIHKKSTVLSQASQ